MDGGTGETEKTDISQRSLKSMLKSASFFFLGMLFGKVAYYFFRLLIARTGTDAYGLFSIAMGVSDITATIAMLGLAYALPKLVSEARARGMHEKVDNLIFSSARIAIVSGIFFGLMLFASSRWIAASLFRNAELQTVLEIFAIAIPFSILGSTIFSIIRGFENANYEIFTRQFVETAAKLSLAVAFIYAGLSLVGISLAYLFSILVMCALAIYFLEFKVHRTFRQPIRFHGVEGDIFRFSTPLMMVGVVYLFISWSDTLFLGFLKNASDVGLYNSAYPTAQMLFMLPSALNILFLSIVAGLLASNRLPEFNRIYTTLAKWILTFNFPLFLVFFFYGRQILRVLFGQQYEVAATSLQVLAAGFMVYSVFTNASDVLSALNKPKLVMYNMIISAIASVSLNYILISGYGIVGAAAATAISLTLYSMLNAYQVYRYTGVFPISDSYVKIILCGATALFLVEGLYRMLVPNSTDLGLVVLGFAYMIAYGGLLLLARVPDRTDFEILSSIEKKAHVDLSAIKKPIKRYYRL